MKITGPEGLKLKFYVFMTIPVYLLATAYYKALGFLVGSVYKEDFTVNGKSIFKAGE